MAKSEIKQFKLKIGEDSYECTVPFSLAGARGSRALSGVAEATVSVDERIKNNKHIYLRLTDVQGLCSVRIGGRSVYDSEFSGRVLNVPVKDALTLGNNTVELYFSDKGGAIRAGLFGKAELLKFDNSAIDRVSVSQSVSGNSCTLDISVDMLGGNDNVRAVATLVSSAGHVFYGGLTRGKGRITVKDALMWWPKGMGVQNLYKLTVNLYGELEIEDTEELRVGIRSITAADESCLLTVGGATLLPMGAVYTAESREDPILSKNREAAYINSAARAGFNALVIKDGDCLPTEGVLDLCDAHGIAVIREISSSRLEESDELDVLARVAHHPSVALYQIIHDKGNAKALKERLARVAPDVAVRILDNAPSYPSHPQLPSEKVISGWLSEKERNLFSEKVEKEGRETLLKMLESASERYPYAGGFSDFGYISALTAAEKIKEKIVDARLERGSSMAVYSSLGGQREGVISAGLDSRATWCALQYYATKFFAPIIISAKHLGGGRVEFYISNERRQSFVGTVEYRIADNRNKTLFVGSEQCVAERSVARLVTSRDFGDIISGHEREYYLEYYLRDPLGVYSRETMLFVPEKYFNFLPPEIEAAVTGSDRRFGITLTAKSFAKGVELLFEDVDAVFYDNYVDVTTSAPIKIACTMTGGADTAEHLKRVLKIRCIEDIKK